MKTIDYYQLKSSYVLINIYCTYLTVFHTTLEVLLIDALDLYFNPSPIVLIYLSIIIY